MPVVEDPVVDLVTSNGTTDAPAALPAHQGPSFEVLRAYSPITYAHQCRTPTLVILCEDDFRANPGQAELLYRVLRSNGCTAEMLRMPNASHVGSWKDPPTGQRAQNEALLEWYRRFLPSMPAGSST
jgi:dipeptidyl aminopeptidase/acylaminoacyl peptidase